jgi:ribosomal protein L20
MPRATNNVAAKARHKKYLKAAKGTTAADANYTEQPEKRSIRVWHMPTATAAIKKGNFADFGLLE